MGAYGCCTGKYTQSMGSLVRIRSTNRILHVYQLRKSPVTFEKLRLPSGRDLTITKQKTGHDRYERNLERSAKRDAYI